ncbi:MAG: hypothetical protein C0173_03240 [Desulfurella sp.]|uniref:hypothetical protein n=1 Tax=Desulfurella sp. TaxID=1962857 RepID=UPI000CB8F520|nr:hypothetical protein [Desulfurella sp.]PMP91622.1 MAG: hypothetical protein C0173_03240 [Desulfurella sp.]
MSQKSFLSQSFLTFVMCFFFFLTLFCNAYAANQTQIAVGKWIAPIIYLGAFALLSQGFMHLDPERKKLMKKL